MTVTRTHILLPTILVYRLLDSLVYVEKYNVISSRVFIAIVPNNTVSFRGKFEK